MLRRNLHGAVVAWQTVSIVILVTLLRGWRILLALVVASGRHIFIILIEYLDPPLVHLFLYHLPFRELLHTWCRPIDFPSKPSLG
jgi:hypothetical protein